jgi:hypothetical protein
MLSWTGGAARRGRALMGACLALGIAQAVAADVYAWRTEDGGYAYTDDRDQIPARYRAQAKRLAHSSLSSYERFTPQDPAATARYAERLERRLAALRAANAPAQRAASAAAAAPAPGTGTLLVSTGDENASQIEVPIAQDGSPVVVEPVLSKRSGDFRTRRSTLVKQGDRTIAVILGPPHNFDPVNGIVDEDEAIGGDE